MAEFDLNIDTDRALVITAKKDSTQKSLPKMVQGDRLRLKVRLFKGFNNVSQYEQIPVDGITIGAAIGSYPPVGGATPHYLTEQWVWTPSTDLADPYFSGALSLRTDELNTALEDERSINATLHIIRTEEAYPVTILLQHIIIYPGTIQDGGLDAVAVATALTAETANATYLVKEGAGYNKKVPFECPTDSSIRANVYLGTDGVLQYEAIA